MNIEHWEHWLLWLLFVTLGGLACRQQNSSFSSKKKLGVSAIHPHEKKRDVPIPRHLQQSSSFSPILATKRRRTSKSPNLFEKEGKKASKMKKILKAKKPLDPNDPNYYFTFEGGSSSSSSAPTSCPAKNKEDGVPSLLLEPSQMAQPSNSKPSTSTQDGRKIDKSCLKPGCHTTIPKPVAPTKSFPPPTQRPAWLFPKNRDVRH